jgi:hypothetical protein
VDKRFEQVDKRFDQIVVSLDRLTEKLDHRDEKLRGFTIRMFSIAITLSLLGYIDNDKSCDHCSCRSSI